MKLYEYYNIPPEYGVVVVLAEDEKAAYRKVRLYCLDHKLRLPDPDDIHEVGVASRITSNENRIAREDHPPQW